ncbi:MAG TPA: DUF2121 domain-containing protein [Methanothermococcus okinawensis]|uniref:DUF2121 domain-containing protein n=1 Tax=Methanothermococcus okinawensis TaxID=155863 RepID=A0A832YSI1_9EURY|nr:DUF2121 domain-containing protein [Methanothermococcus okinawensis]
MSVIIGYYGNNGAVIAGDKRNIIFRGDPKKREELEKSLYSGKIKSDEDLKEKASELGIKIYIEDERTKIKKVNNVLIGEVKSIGLNSQRRKMYLTKGKCAIVDILNDEITKKSLKEGMGLIIFGNKYLKEIVQKELKKYMYDFGRMEIEEIKNIIEEVLRKCDGPTLSEEFDIIYIDEREIDLEKIIEQDIKELREYREKLRQKMIDFKRVMAIADKIENNGEVGIIKDGKLLLNDEHLAIDKICPNPKKFREIDIEGEIKEGDVIIIEDGTLKIRGRNEVPIKTNYIICKR